METFDAKSLAAKMGWRKGGGGSQIYVSDGCMRLRKDRTSPDNWSLSDAGAYDVIKRLKLSLEWASDGLDARVLGLRGDEISRNENLTRGIEQAIVLLNSQ